MTRYGTFALPHYGTDAADKSRGGDISVAPEQ